MKSKALLLLMMLFLPGHALMIEATVRGKSAASNTPPKHSRVASRAVSENSFNLSAFGAVGDGVADDGPALQSALDAIGEAGGGTLFVPAGRYAINTPVLKDFTGLAASVSIEGVESSTPIAPPTGTSHELTRGLDLVSEFFPRTGEQGVALDIRGLQSFLIRDIAFVGTPDVYTDALITLRLIAIENATLRHCEFYGLSTLVGPGLVYSVRSNLTIDQCAFLGSTASSGVYGPIVQNIEWKGVTVTDTLFVDYGERPELYGKLGVAAPFSWINLGNAAALTNDSPRREMIMRNVFLDEGGYIGLSSLPYLYQPPTAPIDLIYITGLHMNVSNLGTMGHYFVDPKNVLIENSHYGWSHNTESAIDLRNVDNAILDRVECVESANRISANADTEKLTVIDSIYTYLNSQSPATRVITTTTPEDDPVQYVRQQFSSILGRDPDGAAHFYWSDLILQCGADTQCVNARRAALGVFLGGNPSPLFAINGQVTDENGAGLSGTSVTLNGASQPVTTETDVNGQYHFSNLPTSGNYTVTASKTHYTFTPPNQSFTTPVMDQIGNFAATLNSHSIIGRVADASGNPVADVTLDLSGTQVGTTTTNANGDFSFANLPAGGNYTVLASKTHYTFAASSLNFSDLAANQTANFVATLNRHSISGQVTDNSGNGLAGVTLDLSGTQVGTTTANANGDFSFANLPAGGNYTVLASKTHYTFAASSLNFSDLAANQTVNFVATLDRHSISGRATASGGNALSGVTVTLSGSQASTTTTDSTGAYAFMDLPAGGNYIVGPSKTSYSWAPQNLSFNDLGINQTANFTGTFVTYSVSGRVTENGAGLSGVSVLLSGSQTGSATTDANGSYSFTLPSEGNYTVTPSNQHFTFAPASRTFDNLLAPQAADFAATRNLHQISGRVVDVNNAGIAGLTVSLSGSQTATATTNLTGDYTFANLPAGGDYTVTPSLQYHSFSPASQTYTNLASNQQTSFVATLNTFTISGRVTEVKGIPLAGVTMTLSGSLGPIATITTSADGTYSFGPLPAGDSYVVAVSKVNYIFNPASRSFSALNSNQTADFSATLQSVIDFSAASYSVLEGTGTITVTVGRVGDTSRESTVIYSAADGTAHQGDDLSSVIGQITFAPGETSQTFTIFITDDAFVENDEQLTVTLSEPEGAILGSLTSATLTIGDNDSGAANPNPVDDAEFFVRQHYRDFLHREPDAAGLAFWSNQIASCGMDTACVEDRRINVSAAFFLSIEFQETGFLVHRLYKASFAQPPRHRDEFLLDTRTIAQGLVVNAPGWQQLLEDNKNALVAEFVERPDFTDRYPLTQTPAQFVNLLNANAGAPLTANDVANAVAEFNGASTSSETVARARVLRLVAESATFTQRELSPAFVLMQYFGYLQRNPSDPPDGNLEGFNFWLSKLNEFGGDFRRAQMVNSFLVSGEYRSRFGL